MSGRCRFDYSEHCAEYGCNACGNYPCTCGTCKYGEEWDGIEIISCTIDMQLHNESDTCDSHKATWWAGGK